MTNYNREKNKRRKINSSSGNVSTKNKFNKNNINDINYILMKARTPNLGGKNINYINNKIKDKNKKPRTPEGKNINIKNNKGNNKDISNKNKRLYFHS